MRTENLLKTLDQMSDDELLVRLREVRHNREVARPVARKKAAKAETKQTRVKQTAAEKLLTALSDEEREKLLEQFKLT